MQNKLGIYYAFLAASDNVDWFDCLERAKASGLDLLEMSVPKLRMLSQSKRDAIAEHACKLGMQLTFATALTQETDLSSDDPNIRAQGIKQMREDLHMIADMGGMAMGGVLTNVSKHFPEGIEHFRGHAVNNAIHALQAVAQTAEKLGINLGMEVVNRFESPLINTCEEAMSALKAVTSPRLGVHLDTFHMNIEEAAPARAIHHAGQRLIHFHICENDRSLPGHGHIDWQSVFAALKSAQYTGPIVIESLPGPYGTIAGRLNIWRKLSLDVDKELAAAVHFLRELMEE